MSSEDKLLRAIDMIEEHLYEPFELEAVASAASVSLRQLQRFFSEMLSTTVLNYITSRRLTEACLLLVNTDKRIIDIALDFQFQTHESFTRAFSREFGKSPSQFRQHGCAFHQKQTPRMDFAMLSLLQNGLLGTPRMMCMPPRKILGFGFQVNHDGCSTPENDEITQHYLEKLTDSKDLLPESPSKSTGQHWIARVPAGTDHQAKRFVGIEVERGAKKIKGLDSYLMPRTQYAVFLQNLGNCSDSERAKLDRFSDSYVMRWLSQHQLIHSHQPWLQRVLSGSPDIREVYIPLESKASVTQDACVWSCRSVA